MKPEVNAISNRLSLRPPQRDALVILDRLTEIISLEKGADPMAALEAIRSEYPSVTDFERDFPSVCFALATGVGKTRLMGAFISYLHQAHGMDNFFVLAPNLTIYNKLISDFSPASPKYVFKGISAFASTPPEVITGDNYESRGTLLSQLVSCKINIFNISKINSEVRGGKSPRIKRLSEYIGQSYFEYLAGLPDLVLIMDESHRYRASAGVRAINELKPVLGLELTATPYVETNRGGVPFRNVILDYPLGKAMSDGFVKEPAVVTRKDFNPSNMSESELEKLKLEDAVRLHEQTKVVLQNYAASNDKPVVKPFVLVIARDTTHATQLLERIQSSEFFAGYYADKVIQVDSSKTGAEEDLMIERLLRVEHGDEPTEIVIHVNMLKEGWDVTNLYTIVPLRAANARTLIEQSIGRGLRLPYGIRTGVEEVDRLTIVAHDRFQEIVDEARRPDSIIQLKSIVLDDEQLNARPRLVEVKSWLEEALTPSITSSSGDERQPPTFSTPAESELARRVFDIVKELESQKDLVPTTKDLQKPEVQDYILRELSERYTTAQPELEGFNQPIDVAEVVAKATQLVQERTIDIPRILVQPTGEVRSGFRTFTLDVSNLNLRAQSDALWMQYLREGEGRAILGSTGKFTEERLEDYIVAGLIDKNDVAYDQHADLLYDLAGQAVQHLKTLQSDEEVERVLRMDQRLVVDRIYTQMQAHYWEDAEGYEVTVARGFTEIRKPSLTSTHPPRDFRQAPAQLNEIGKYEFVGFQRNLHSSAKFDSDTERVLAVILDRDSLKWFRPARGQFRIYYRFGGEPQEYQPDFVAETEDYLCMIESKRRADLDDGDVLAKQAAALLWCKYANEEHALKHGTKPWRYVLIPHDEVATNKTLTGLLDRYAQVP